MAGTPLGWQGSETLEEVARPRTAATSRGGYPSKRLFEILLSVQPVAGFLNPIIVRFQASPTPLPNDRAGTAGVWRELWFGNSSPDRRTTPRHRSSLASLYGGSATVYPLLCVAIEDKLGQAVASLACRRYLGQATGGDRGAYKAAEREFEDGSVVRRQPGLYAGYLVVKCTVLAAVSAVAHPFSILRTVVMARGDVPLAEEGFWANVVRYAGPTDSLGLYTSSVATHVASSLAEAALTDVALRSIRWMLHDKLQAQRTASGVEQRRRWQRQRRHGDQQPLELPGTHQDRLTARLNGAAIMSALHLGVTFAVRAVLFPLFTVRARLEAQGGDDCAPVTALRHQGMGECMRAIWAEEGAAGFYRGFTAHMMTFTVSMLWSSLIYGLTRIYIHLDIEDDDEDEEN